MLLYSGMKTFSENSRNRIPHYTKPYQYTILIFLIISSKLIIESAMKQINLRVTERYLIKFHGTKNGKKLPSSTIYWDSKTVLQYWRKVYLSTSICLQASNHKRMGVCFVGVCTRPYSEPNNIKVVRSNSI